MICEKDIKILREKHDLPEDKLSELLSTDEFDRLLSENADEVRRENYGTDVYIRGLIEFSNICKNNCLYCGVRRDNGEVERYRLEKEDILACCDEGHKLGFRTFVLQGGEDPHFSDDIMCDIVSSIKKKYPDCAVTLSLGERSAESYEKLFAAGADRYLLRHETANEEHYRKLHPAEMSLENRKKCLFELKRIGYQVGSGFMVGSPYQTIENIVEDLRFLQKLQPDMIGIGPFVKHTKTPLGEFENGSVELTLRIISVLRLIFPKSLIPATTALGTLRPDGRELGLKAGANVVMPNLSPVENRRKYEIYENKICLGDEAAQCIVCLKNRVKNAGYNIVENIGNAKTRG
ncbi:MAG: [Clostridia bacterium]|nr:[FeFe] hydrogenase H-cluster radical SAM maturase HydE [Clostridia bacterium]